MRDGVWLLSREVSEKVESASASLQSQGLLGRLLGKLLSEVWL